MTDLFPGPAIIENPILRGFNPDPSILRVGEDYFIATSTFEWRPGVQIHHSRDLVNWRLLTHALGAEHLDLRGAPDSGGVWAPCLTHDGELFHLIFTDVKFWSEVNAFKDSHNFLTTATNILGPWSEPVYLNSSGFDPSLFHDADGRKWLLNALWDHRQGKNHFGGILLQEYDPAARRLVGPVRNIFAGTELRVTEAPHLYRRDGWHYLMTAEGGTAYRHAVTMARSRDLFGPYEVDPNNPMLTSAGRPELALQKAGHASLVETTGGEWFLAHLCGRPLDGPGAPPDGPGAGEARRCNLGRETALQAVEWTPEGWLRLRGGGNSPLERVTAPRLPAHPWPAQAELDDFDGPNLSEHWSTLRTPPDPSWLSLLERPGFLRLRGRESPSSHNRQSLVARRLQAQHAVASTALEFEPQNFQQMAGLILYYDSSNFIYLHVTRDEALGKVINVSCVEGGSYREPLANPLPIDSWKRVHLRATFNGSSLRLAYADDGHRWRDLDLELDAGQLSDEAGHLLGFTGTFVGVCAQDLSGGGLHADFDAFTYRELQANS